MSDKQKAAFEKSVEYVNKWLQTLDAFDDGLMKAHEFIGVVQDRVDEAFEFARDSVFSLSELLDEYRNGVWERVAEAEKLVYPVAEADGCPADTSEDEQPVDDNLASQPVKPTSDMSHEEKAEFLIQEYDLDRSSEQKQALMSSSPATLSEAVNILRMRKHL